MAGADSREGEKPRRLLCCFCGETTADSLDYIEIEVIPASGRASQLFGAHAAHLNEAMASGFATEVHLM
jgi:hypothetical protein